MAQIILTPLEIAIGSLRLACEQEKNEFIRDAVIQRFEYTYELCWKMLRRQLVEDLGSESVNGLSRKDLPYRVDIVDWARISSEFKVVIKPQLIALL